MIYPCRDRFALTLKMAKRLWRRIVKPVWPLLTGYDSLLRTNLCNWFAVNKSLNMLEENVNMIVVSQNFNVFTQLSRTFHLPGPWLTWESTTPPYTGRSLASTKRAPWMPNAWGKWDLSGPVQRGDLQQECPFEAGSGRGLTWRGDGGSVRFQQRHDSGVPAQLQVPHWKVQTLHFQLHQQGCQHVGSDLFQWRLHGLSSRHGRIGNLLAQL